MKTIKDMLDEVKKAKSIETRYALAKALGLPTQRISDYYNSKGSKYPNNYTCLKIAEALNKDIREIILLVEIEKEKNNKKREEWKKYYQKIKDIVNL